MYAPYVTKWYKLHLINICYHDDFKVSSIVVTFWSNIIIYRLFTHLTRVDVEVFLMNTAFVGGDVMWVEMQCGQKYNVGGKAMWVEM